MIKKYLLFFLGIACSFKMLATNFPILLKSTFKSSKTYYASWGYNKDWFSKSDLNLRMGLGNKYAERADYFNLVIHDAKAKDRPDFDKITNLQTVTVPQFNARIGFVSKQTNFGLEICYDHAKYVVTDNQTLRVTGQFHGNTVDTVMKIDPSNFLHLEHTDGANFWMCNLTKTFKLTPTYRFFQLHNMVKAGGGILIPRTDVTFLGNRKDNDFHIAGYVFGVENAIQLGLGKHFYTEVSGKYAFAYYTNALINKAQETYITHKFHTLMAFVNVGMRF